MPQLSFNSSDKVDDCMSPWLVVAAEMHATSAGLFDTRAAEDSLRDCLDALAATLGAAA
jgi:hypothetical protein